MQAKKESNTSGGIALSWGAEHRDKDGYLISRMVSVAEPEFPKCRKLRCILKWWLWDMTRYVLIVNYHAKRVEYAEANRNKRILERYRTGSPSPDTMWQALHANLKIKCPVCRKYNVDPLLFDRRKA